MYDTDETDSASPLTADNAPLPTYVTRAGVRDSLSVLVVTQLGKADRGGIHVTIWPECGEATVVALGGDGSVEEVVEPGPASLTALADVLRAEESQRVRASRARGRIRRYVVRNLLTRMWTLTFAEATYDRASALESMQEFARSLRVHFGGSIPYLYVFELHPQGHGWHVHLLTQSRYVEKRTLQRLWGHGIVQYSDGPKRHARSKREVARGCARYASKYVGKDIGNGLPPKVHAYEPAQGFQPEKVSRSAVSMREGVGVAVRYFGGVAPCETWASADSEDWSGPPVVTLRFDDDG